MKELLEQCAKDIGESVNDICIDGIVIHPLLMIGWIAGAMSCAIENQQVQIDKLKSQVEELAKGKNK